MRLQYKGMFVVLHLLVILFVCVSLLTGLAISTVSRDDWLMADFILPQGRVHQIHLYSGMGILTVTILYGVLRSQFRQRILNQGFHIALKYLAYIAMLSLCLSGVFAYLGYTDGVIGRLLSEWHYISAITLMVFFILHGVILFLQRGLLVLKQVFNKQALLVGYEFFVFLIVVSFVVKIYFDAELTHEITVLELESQQAINIDGFAEESFWHDAEEAIVFTHGGANFLNGRTAVSIKAATNDKESYFLFRWFDNSESLLHLPLQKEVDGWRVLGAGFSTFNETAYYEDKFAVMLSTTCEFGADGTALVGRNPLSNRPSNWHGKGYHASLDGRIRDLWHWKAVRTNSMLQADDNYFGPPLSVRLGERRYTAGYQVDGKESGAYVMNWQWYNPKYIQPKRLPSNPKVAITSPLAWFQAQPYRTDIDHYPVGTRLPSVLLRSNQFEGDRGDVRARGVWQDNYWTLEMARKNNTGSEKDVMLQDEVCMWVSAFDHAQVAHTRHNRPLRLNYPSEGLLQ
ncbi:ethylbenzene dehydrogenase-related protein [Shewanella waksmanii]|uniref:ethylbenzene dehydrogenase-related protein n=1 Tax=Shewanella waksmanii TaxID=213783 RepID=UPI0037369391